MNSVREYFNKKYDKKNNPQYLQGVLRTLGLLPTQDETQEEGVIEK